MFESSLVSLEAMKKCMILRRWPITSCYGHETFLRLNSCLSYLILYILCCDIEGI